MILIFALFFAAAALAEERLYVVQVSDESLAAIGIESGAVDAHVLDLGYGCNEIIAHGNRLYVTNSLQNTVQEIDAENHVTLRDIQLPGGVNPYALAVLNPDTLAITNFVSNNLLLLRLSTGAFVANIPVGLAPEGVLVHADRVYVCLTRMLPNFDYAPGVVMVYDRRSLAFVDSIPVGINPQFAAVDDRNQLHVVCTGNYVSVAGQVVIVNLTTLELLHQIEIGGTPAKISMGGEYAYLAAGGWAGSGEVFQYRLDDFVVVRGAGNPIRTGLGATDVSAMPDGTFFVSCFMIDVVEQRSSDGNLIRTYNLSDGPGALLRYPGPANSMPRQTQYPDQQLILAYPNPFKSGIHLKLAAAARSATIVNIYNVIGQRVAAVPIPASHTSAIWTPRSHNVNDLVSGTYIVRMEDGGGGEALRIVYIR